MEEDNISDDPFAALDALDAQAQAPGTPAPAKRGVLGTVADVGSSVVRGVAKAADETLDTAGELGYAAGSAIRDALPEDTRIAVQKTLSPAANAFRDWGFMTDGGEVGINIDDGFAAVGVQDSQTMVGGFAGDTAQFVAGFIGASRALKGVGAGVKGAVIKGAVADFTVFDPSEERLANMAESVGIPYAELLTYNPGDSRLEGRLKQAVEGAIAGAAFDALFHSVRGLLKGKAGDIKGAKADADIAEKAADAAAKDEPFVAPPEPEQLQLGLDAPEVKAAPGDPSLPAVRDPVAEAAGDPPLPSGPRSLKDLLSPEKADEAMARTIDNIKSSDTGDFSFNEGYDPLTDINPKFLESERGVVEVAHAIGKAADEHMGAARGVEVETWAMVKKNAKGLADDFLTTPDELASNLARVVGEGQNLSSTLTALRTMAVSSRKNVLRNMEAYSAGKSPETMEQLFNSLQTLANIQAATKGYSSGLGRALNSAKIVLSESNDISKVLASMDDPRMINSLDPTGKSTSAGDALDKLMQRMAAAGGNPKAMARVLQPSAFARTVRVAETWYTSSILSNPGTLLVNLGGGLQKNLFQPLERSLGGLMVADREIAREGMDQLYETWSSSFDALRVASRAWVKNSPILEGASARGQTVLGDVDTGGISAKDLGVKDNSLVGAALNGMNAVTSITFRNILFTDELVRQMAFVGRSRAGFARAGRTLGLTGDALKKHIDDEMDRTHQNGEAVRDAKGEIVNADAAAEGRAAVFQQQLERGSNSHKFEAWARSIPGSRIILSPFIRTPINILKDTIRRTPALRHVLEDVRTDLKSPDKNVRAQAEGRMAMGTTMYGTFMMMSFGGMFTGAGFKNQRDAYAVSKLGGWSPFSYVDQATGKHYSISRNDPIASHIMIAATLAEMTQVALRSGDEDKDMAQMAQTGADILFTSVTASLKDKTYLQGIADLVELFDNPDGETFAARSGKFFGSKAGGFVPSLVAGSSLDLQETASQRAANDWLDYVQKRLPVFEDKVDKAYDVLGRPIEGGMGWPSNVFNISRESIEADPVYDELISQYLASGKLKDELPKTEKGVKLTEIASSVPGQSARARWQEIQGTVKLNAKYQPSPSGVTLYEMVAAKIGSDEYKNELTDGDVGYAGTRLEAIGKIMTAYKKASWKQLVAETPDLQVALGETLIKKIAAEKAGSDPLPADGRQTERTIVNDFIRTYQ